MTTPSGQISLSQVNTELGFSSTAVITMNDAAVRSLAGVPTGAITMANLQNKSNTFNATISSPQTNLDLITYLTPLGYTPGGAASIIIAPGVTISATSTGNVGLTIPSAFGAGKLTLTNNGQIFGKGGDSNPTPNSPGFFDGNAGGVAMSIGTPIILTNNSFIAGGGGGGVGATNSASGTQASGGGGAGGGGVGGSGPGNANFNSGGTGGTSFPGTGGAGIPSPSPPSNGNPGTAGGGGGHRFALQRIPGPANVYRVVNAGGGGGWGAAGGAASSSTGAEVGFGSGASGAGGSSNVAGGAGNNNTNPTISGGSGGAGGKAINLNGNSISYPATGTIWGTVS